MRHCGRGRPPTGLWVGTKGTVTISFTVDRHGGRLFVANRVSACRGSGVADLPDNQKDNQGNVARYRILSDGTVPSWPYDTHMKLTKGVYHQVRSGPPPKLLGTTGVVSENRAFPYSSTAAPCPTADAHGVRVRHVAARPVRDGVYHAVGSWHTLTRGQLKLLPDFEVVVSGGGMLATTSHSVADPLFFVARSGCALSNWSDESALISPGGSFSISGTGQREFSVGDEPTAQTYEINGAFSSPGQLNGGYSATNTGCGILDPTSESLSASYTTTAFSDTNDGAPVGTVPAPPLPAPPAPTPGKGLGPPQVSHAKGCQPKVTTGAVEALASCFTVRGHEAVAHDRVRVNGIDLLPASRGAIHIDLANGRLSTDGPVWVVVGPLRLARLRPHWDLARSVLFSAQSPEHEAESEGDAKQKEEVPKERKLGGILSVEGSIEMKWEPGKTVLKGTVKFPKTVFTSKVDGEVSFAATNERRAGAHRGQGDLPDDHLGPRRVSRYLVSVHPHRHRREPLGGRAQALLPRLCPVPGDQTARRV